MCAQLETVHFVEYKQRIDDVGHHVCRDLDSLLWRRGSRYFVTSTSNNISNVRITANRAAMAAVHAKAAADEAAGIEPF